MRRRSILVSCAVLWAAVAVDGRAHATPSGAWPTFAQNYQRTNRADGVGEIHAPMVAWSVPMGGVLGEDQTAYIPQNGSAPARILTISAGRVSCQRADGSEVWRSPQIAARSLLGVWALDGKTGPKVVVDVAGGVKILDAEAGALLQTIALPAPAKASFVLAGAGGVLVLASSRDVVEAFDFRSGIPASIPAWTSTSGFQNEFLVGDVDGDGVSDLVRPLETGFEIDDPLTGKVKYSLDPLFKPAFFYQFQLADVDGKPGDEIVVVDDSYIYSTPTAIHVLGVRGAKLASFWSLTKEPAEALGANFATVADCVADLDRDGKMELVFGELDGLANRWTTHVVDAASGAELGSVSDSLVEALVDLDGDGKKELLVRSGLSGSLAPARSTIRAFDFASRASGPVARSWTLERARTVPSLGRPRDRVSSGLLYPATIQLGSPATGDGVLVAVDPTNLGRDAALAIATRIGAGAPSFALSPGTTPTVVVTAPDLSASGPGLAVATDDGLVHVMTPELVESSNFGAGTYSNWVSAVPFGEHTRIVAQTSLKQLRVLDGTAVDGTGRPTTMLAASAVVPTGGFASSGFPFDPAFSVNTPGVAVAVVVQGASNQSLVGLDADGKTQWRTNLPPGTTVTTPGGYVSDVVGDPAPELVIQARYPDGTTTFLVFDTSSGSQLLTSDLSEISVDPPPDSATTGALVDINGDGKLDLVTPVHNTGLVAIDMTTTPMRKLWTLANGTSGIAIHNGTVGAWRPTDDRPPQLFRFNGNTGIGDYLRVNLDGSLAAHADLGARRSGADGNAAAALRTATGFDLVVAGTGEAQLSKLQRLAGTDFGVLWTAYASNGAVSKAPPAERWALHDPLTMDVDGDGNDEIVFGSDDGYLYGLRAADGVLVFALDLGAPVAHVIAANIDTDPALELVAFAGDGRLMAIDEKGRYTPKSPEPPDAGLPPASDAGLGLGPAAPLAPTGSSLRMSGSGCACELRGMRDGSKGPWSSASGLVAIGAMLAARRRRCGTSVQSP